MSYFKVMIPKNKPLEVDLDFRTRLLHDPDETGNDFVFGPPELHEVEPLKRATRVLLQHLLSNQEPGNRQELSIGYTWAQP